MRVCHLIDTWFPIYGGGPKSTLELSRILASKYNCHTDIITRALPDQNGHAFIQNESYCGGRVRVHRVRPCASFTNIPARLWYLIAAIPYILRGGYDLIHATAFLPGIPAKVAQFFTNLPIIYTIHGTALGAWSGEKVGLRRKVYLLVERWLLLKIHYDFQITVSRNFLEFPNVNREIVVIPNGIDTTPFDKIEIAKSTQFKILYVGRFDPIKGVDILLEAMLQVKKRYTSVQLTLVGYGWAEKDYKEFVQVNDLSDTVQFTGFLSGEELVQEYKSSHLFVLPSRSEGQPHTLLEAWAAKLPVVVTQVGANPDFVEEGVNGYLVPPKHPDLLAEAIIKAIENPTLSDLGLRGYKMVREKYSWDNVANQTYRVYQEVLKRRTSLGDPKISMREDF